jgi:hypothetical protein
VAVASALTAILPLSEYAQVTAMGGAAKYCVHYYSSAGTKTRNGLNVIPGVACWNGQPQYVGMWLFWVALAVFLVALSALIYRLVRSHRLR